jgi:ABC-type bacteriocin/lantibiotic exporter with double-glycine peptidase domain
MRYIFLTGLLTLVYVALIFLAVQVFAFTAPVTVAAATVAAVLLFNPTRRRLQRALNRRYHHPA